MIINADKIYFNEKVFLADRSNISAKTYIRDGKIYAETETNRPVYNYGYFGIDGYHETSPIYSEEKESTNYLRNNTFSLAKDSLGYETYWTGNLGLVSESYNPEINGIDNSKGFSSSHTFSGSEVSGQYVLSQTIESNVFSVSNNNIYLTLLLKATVENLGNRTNDIVGVQVVGLDSSDTITETIISYTLAELVTLGLDDTKFKKFLFTGSITSSDTKKLQLILFKLNNSTPISSGSFTVNLFLPQLELNSIGPTSLIPTYTDIGVRNIETFNTSIAYYNENPDIRWDELEHDNVSISGSINVFDVKKDSEILVLPIRCDIFLFENYTSSLDLMEYIPDKFKLDREEYPIWEKYVTYKKGSYVLFQNSIWEAIKDNVLAITPDNSTYWRYVREQNKSLLRTFIDELNMNVGSWLSKIDDLQRIIDKYEVSETYIDYLAALIDLKFLNIQNLTLDDKKRQLIEAINWYKIKGSYNALNFLIRSTNRECDIYDLWTHNYSDFIPTNWHPTFKNQLPFTDKTLITETVYSAPNGIATRNGNKIYVFPKSNEVGANGVVLFANGFNDDGAFKNKELFVSSVFGLQITITPNNYKDIYVFIDENKNLTLKYFSDEISAPEEDKNNTYWYNPITNYVYKWNGTNWDTVVYVCRVAKISTDMSTITEFVQYQKYYKSPHTNISVELDKLQVDQFNQLYLYREGDLDKIKDAIESIRPVNTVFNYSLKLSALTTELNLGYIIQPNQIKTAVSSKWRRTKEYFDTNKHFDVDDLYFDQDYLDIIESVSNWKIGIGNKNSAPNSPDFELQYVVLTGGNVKKRVYEDKVEFEILVENENIQGISELGLYNDMGDPIVFSTFPDINITPIDKLVILVTVLTGISYVDWEFAGGDRVGREHELYLDEKIAKEYHNLYDRRYNRLCLTAKSMNRWDTWDMDWETAEKNQFEWDYPKQPGVYNWYNLTLYFDAGTIKENNVILYSQIAKEVRSPYLGYFATIRTSLDGKFTTPFEVYEPLSRKYRYFQMGGTFYVMEFYPTYIYYNNPMAGLQLK